MGIHERNLQLSPHALTTQSRGIRSLSVTRRVYRGVALTRDLNNKLAPAPVVETKSRCDPSLKDQRAPLMYLTTKPATSFGARDRALQQRVLE